MILWSGPARDDLAELRSFLSDRDPALASRTTLAILDAVERLADRPALGRPGRVPGTREWSLRRPPFLIVYRMAEDGIEVIRVLHTARQWPQKI